MAAVIDSDQHLFESRSLWADHIDPARRDDALAIVDDELGYSVADVAGPAARLGPGAAPRVDRPSSVT